MNNLPCSTKIRSGHVVLLSNNRPNQVTTDDKEKLLKKEGSVKSDSSVSSLGDTSKLATAQIDLPVSPADESFDSLSTETIDDFKSIDLAPDVELPSRINNNTLDKEISQEETFILTPAEGAKTEKINEEMVDTKTVGSAAKHYDLPMDSETPGLLETGVKSCEGIRISSRVFVGADTITRALQTDIRDDEVCIAFSLKTIIFPLVRLPAEICVLLSHPQIIGLYEYFTLTTVTNRDLDQSSGSLGCKPIV